MAVGEALLKAYTQHQLWRWVEMVRPTTANQRLAPPESETQVNSGASKF